MLEDVELHIKTPQEYAKHTQVKAKEGPLDLNQELVENYNLAKAYLEALLEVEGSEEDDAPTKGTTPNQIAAVIQSVKATLQDLIKMQTEVYNAERNKKMEAAMIKAIKMMPEDARQAFIDEYERILNVQ